MNKKLIAVAVAGVVAAPAAYADISAYGRIHNRIQISDDGTNKTENMNTTGSRFGFKGSSDLGNGMKASARYEFGTNTDNSTGASGLSRRLGFVGLEGHFGKITLGQQWSAYYTNVGTYASPNIANGPGQQLGPFRTGNTLQYANSIGPISFKLDGRVDDGGTKKDASGNYYVNADGTLKHFADGQGNGFGFGATISAIDNVTLGFGYDTHDGYNPSDPSKPRVPGTDTMGVSATVGFGILHLALSHEQQEVGMLDHSNTVVGLSARVASNLTLSAAFGQTEKESMDATTMAIKSAEKDRTNVSATYNFGGGLRAWVEAANVDGGPQDDTDYFAAGLRMDF